MDADELKVQEFFAPYWTPNTVKRLCHHCRQMVYPNDNIYVKVIENPRPLKGERGWYAFCSELCYSLHEIVNAPYSF